MQMVHRSSKRGKHSSEIYDSQLFRSEEYAGKFDFVIKVVLEGIDSFTGRRLSVVFQKSVPQSWKSKISTTHKTMGQDGSQLNCFCLVVVIIDQYQLVVQLMVQMMWLCLLHRVNEDDVVLRE